MLNHRRVGRPILRQTCVYIDARSFLALAPLHSNFRQVSCNQSPLSASSIPWCRRKVEDKQARTPQNTVARVGGLVASVKVPTHSASF